VHIEFSRENVLDIIKFQYPDKKKFSDRSSESTSFPNHQFSVTHTIRQTKIPALVDSWVTNTLFVKMYSEKNCFLFYFRTNETRLTVGLLILGHVMSGRCKTVYRR
jgi:hypothetical protein